MVSRPAMADCRRIVAENEGLVGDDSGRNGKPGGFHVKFRRARHIRRPSFRPSSRRNPQRLPRVARIHRNWSRANRAIEFYDDRRVPCGNLKQRCLRFRPFPFLLSVVRDCIGTNEYCSAFWQTEAWEGFFSFFFSWLQGVGPEVMQNRAMYTWWTPTCEIGGKRGHLYRYHGRTNVRQTTRPIFVLWFIARPRLVKGLA